MHVVDVVSKVDEGKCFESNFFCYVVSMALIVVGEYGENRNLAEFASVFLNFTHKPPHIFAKLEINALNFKYNFEYNIKTPVVLRHLRCIRNIFFLNLIVGCWFQVSVPLQNLAIQGLIV